ncbi:MAG: SlyX family protein [Planctomycetota bacterium]
MPSQAERRLIDLEMKFAFQERALGELDEQLRWALGRLERLERRLARAEERLVGGTGADPIEGVGYERGSAAPQPPEPEGRA